MAPASKRARTSQAHEKYLCHSCTSERASKAFPAYNPSADCEHLIHTCTSCLKAWIEAQVWSGNFAVDKEDAKVFGVKCPQCDGIMRNVNIEMAATKKVYQRFEELERKHIANATPGWRWCLNPACRSGQVYEVGEREADVDVDVFACVECGAKACVTCDRPWHGGETCAEYQVRIKDRVNEEDEALRKIGENTKACPGCESRIEKDGGCPMMFCTQCGSHFCWECNEVPDAKGLCACERLQQR